MEYYGIETKGYFQLPSDTSLPVWSSNDEAKLLYNSVLTEVYLATDSEWVQIITDRGGVLSGQMRTEDVDYGSYFKNITISDSVAVDGSNGDIWLQFV